MEERYYIKVGNCYAKFLPLHGIRMFSDYRKASPYLTKEKAENEAKGRVVGYKIVMKML